MRAGRDELALCGVVGVVGIGVVAAGDGEVRGSVHVVGWWGRDVDGEGVGQGCWKGRVRRVARAL